MVLLTFALLLAGQASPDRDDGASAAPDPLRQVVTESRQCLLREVRRGLAGRRALTPEERSALRIAAANACYAYDEKLAGFTRDYRDGAKSLREVAARMAAESLRLADAFIAIELGRASE